MLSERYKFPEVDRRNWLHVPSLAWYDVAINSTMKTLFYHGITELISCFKINHELLRANTLF